MSTISLVDLHEPGITHLLGLAKGGDHAAVNVLLPLVYEELRRIASGHLRRHAANTFQATELINEAWLRLASTEQPDWQSRLHFFAFTAAIMRNILVDHARTKTSEKRGGGRPPLSLDSVVTYAPEAPEELLALDEGLRKLAAIDERKARILELRFFAGLDLEETGKVLGLSTPTIVRETRFAQAWLKSNLSR